jgi:hypothetical protein
MTADHTNMSESGKDMTVVGVLTIKEANQEDNGVFRCMVVAQELERLVRIDDGPRGNQLFPTGVSVDLEVAVAQKPEVEVYPKTLTMLKNDKVVGLFMSSRRRNFDLSPPSSPPTP